MNTIVKKSKPMITSIIYGKINFVMLVNMAIAQINHSKPVFDSEGNIVVELSLTKCAEILGYSLEQQPRAIKKNIDRLLNNGLKENLITVLDNAQETEKRFLITGYKTSTKTDKITIFFNKYFASMILVNYTEKDGMYSVNNRFIKYDLNMFLGCSSANTLAIYELLNLYSYKKDSVFSISYDDLRKYLDIKDSKVNAGRGKSRIKFESYLSYKNFKHDILTPAVEYINNNTDIKVTVVKEDKIKYTYELNKEKKVVSSVDKIYFKIDRKEEKKYNINPITDLASDMNLSIEEALQGVRYLQNYLKEKDGIYLEELQVINLYKISNQDATLVRCAVLDAKYKSVDDIGAYAYTIIKKVIAEESIESYKTQIRKITKAVKDSKKRNKEKEVFKLEGLNATSPSLVEVYEYYLDLTGMVSEEDVDRMSRCLISYNVASIKKAILNSYKILSKKGNDLKSFKYVETMLNKNVFNGRKKESV